MFFGDQDLTQNFQRLCRGRAPFCGLLAAATFVTRLNVSADFIFAFCGASEPGVSVIRLRMKPEPIHLESRV